MKRFKLLLLLIIGIFTACSVNEESQKLVNESEIRPYLSNQLWVQKSGLVETNENIEFWKKKLQSNDTPVYKMKLAEAYQSKFGITKEVEYLAKAEVLLIESNEYYKGENAGVLQALAQHAVTKHNFQQALDYAEQAIAIGEDRVNSLMIIFDASMETGDFEHAQYILDNELKNKSAFNYLIRKSQFEDYSGNASESIAALEQGAKRIEYSSSLSAWANSNLGDRLGHEGNVPKAYTKFLSSLAQENSGASYLHALKGVAYIAYAHDGNTEFAKEILAFVSDRNATPDSYLMLAEIAEFERNDDLKSEYLEKFYTEASNPKYYGMYDTELIELAAIEYGDFEHAEALLQSELQNRPNPMTYDLLAWVKFHKGEVKEAQQILNEFVLDKTYEPIPAYHAGIIMKASGNNEKATELLNYAKEAGFELGPVTVADINSKL